MALADLINTVYRLCSFAECTVELPLPPNATHDEALASIIRLQLQLTCASTVMNVVFRPHSQTCCLSTFMCSSHFIVETMMIDYCLCFVCREMSAVLSSSKVAHCLTGQGLRCLGWGGGRCSSICHPSECWHQQLLTIA